MTLSIHHETIRVILSLLSSQLYIENVTDHSIFLVFLMRRLSLLTYNYKY